MIMSDSRRTECPKTHHKNATSQFACFCYFHQFFRAAHSLTVPHKINKNSQKSSSISILGDYHLILAISRCIEPNYIHFTVLTSRVAVGVTILLAVLEVFCAFRGFRALSLRQKEIITLILLDAELSFGASKSSCLFCSDSRTKREVRCKKTAEILILWLKIDEKFKFHCSRSACIVFV